MSRIGDFVGLLRTLDRLLALEEKHGRAIERLKTELDELAARVQRLEAREEVLVAEAKGASAAAATVAVSQSIADLSRRLGQMEGREQIREGGVGAGRRRTRALPPPDAE